MELRMHRLIRDNTMQACFPNVEILVYDGHELHLRAFVFEAATNREGQRTTIGQGRLNMPTIDAYRERIATHA